LRVSEGFILAYSCSSQSDFESVYQYLHQIERAMEATTKWSGIIVGITSCRNRHERVISTEEGQKLAQDWGCSFIMEAEPTFDGVEQIFSTLVGQI
ncbi:hypothetical protein BDZ45DRAFT_587782, partial [Acephala macrosclerotiorum]